MKRNRSPELHLASTYLGRHAVMNKRWHKKGTRRRMGKIAVKYHRSPPSIACCYVRASVWIQSAPNANLETTEAAPREKQAMEIAPDCPAHAGKDTKIIIANSILL